MKIKEDFFMAVTVKVQTGELRNASATVGNKITALENVVTALNAQIRTLNSYWSGGAHDAFVSAINSDIEQIRTFIDEAKDYKRDLTRIATEYESAENRNKSTLSNRSYK